jgi:putative copper export protein
MIFLAWAIPVWVLQQGGHKTGEQIQPRYLLPLFIVVIGVLLLQKTSEQVVISSRAGQIGITVALAIAQSIALHANMRRYTTGTVRGGADLDYERDWWWASLPDFFGANAVWIIGSLSFFALLWICIRNANAVLPLGAPLAQKTRKRHAAIP